MIRLIVSDLDGCLFDGNGHLPEDFEETFQLMQTYLNQLCQEIKWMKLPSL